MEKQESECKMKIMDFMKENEVLTDDQGKKLGSWRTDKRQSRRLHLNKVEIA
jgi:hypothetical protein